MNSGKLDTLRNDGTLEVLDNFSSDQKNQENELGKK